MKLTKKNVLLAALVIAVLAGVFWWGGNAPGLHGWDPNPQAAAPAAPTVTPALPAPSAQPAVPTPSAAPELTPAPARAPTAVQPAAAPLPTEGIAPRPGGGGDLTSAEKQAGSSAAGVSNGDPNYSAEHGMVIDSATGKDKYFTDPVPEGKPTPIEPENAVVSDKEYTCTLSVSCAAILDNPDWLDPEKVALVPPDGVVLPATTVTFYEGESVFNVLVREMKRNKIHMEFVNTPLYNSAYIEGIHNLYEFDCGELSGWMYRVNGWFPNYGCSRYPLKQGDVVEWIYTCNLGADVGGFAASGNGESGA